MTAATIRLLGFPTPGLAPDEPRALRKDRCEAVAQAIGEHAINWRARYFAGTGHDHTKCRRFAVVELGGRKLCAQHAGQITLRDALRAAGEIS